MDLFGTATAFGGVRYAWRGPSVLIVGLDGWAGEDPLTGFYFRQTRHLARLRLRIGGADLHPCSIAEAAPHRIESTYIHPEVERGDGGGSGSGGLAQKDGLLFRDLDVRMRYLVRPASLDVSVELTNRWQDEVALDVAWLLAADFMRIEDAAFGAAHESPPTDRRPVQEGLDFVHEASGMSLRTEIRWSGASDWTSTLDGIVGSLKLPRQRRTELRLNVRAVDEADPIDGRGEEERQMRQRSWLARATRLHAQAETPLATITNAAVRDVGSLALLDGPQDEWLTPAAGVPVYLSLWGRDALTAAWQAGIVDRGQMLEDVLACLARLQGSRVDASRDEQPGRIVAQLKREPLSRLGHTAFERSYADVASPFMFIIGLGYHYALTGDLGHVSRHWRAALRVLDWADRYGDRHGDGYITYFTVAPGGPRHQGWKDSGNAVVDELGQQVAPPIAPCEIQGYWFVSLQFMSVMALALGQRTRALGLWRQAADLEARFNRDFWMEDLGFIAFGLGPDRRPIKALTSNAGQCLPTGIVAAEHVPRLVRRLFEPDLFSGWGIRTLSTDNPAYHPLDYHLGSVWPVENATIVFGLRRYGFIDRASELVRALYDLALLWPGGRTPEFVGGYGRDEAEHPGCYPRANRPQLWNQSVWPLVVQSLLGIVPYAPAKLLLVDPALPEWLPELTVERLRVGDATVTLRFFRESDGTSGYEVKEREGKLRVVRQPWLESFEANAWDRLAALAQSARVAVSGRL